MRVEPIKDKGVIIDCIEYLQRTSPRNATLFALGIYTGLRISDILKLRVRDVKDKNRLEIKQKKTGNYVYIPVSPELKKILNEYTKDKGSNEYLIKSREGYNKPITRNMAYIILNDMADLLGIDAVGTHTMRKTAGYHLYNASGKDIGLVMQILGQKDQGSTLRYIGISDMDAEKLIKKLSYYN